ncbi:pseudouridine synthase [Planctomycetota bacterium]|nr:pseudouridine synthase [Planctomycetota bacterium]
MTAHAWTVPAADAGQRLDTWLAARVVISRSQVAALIAQGNCSLTNASGQVLAVRAGLLVRGGEQISLEVPAAEAPDLVGEDLPLTVLHEDADLLAIAKPAGQVVHPSPGHPRGTLLNAVVGRYGPALFSALASDETSGFNEETADEDDAWERRLQPADGGDSGRLKPAPPGDSGRLKPALPGGPPGDSARLGLVHRLDAETSGVIVFARTASSLAFLQAAFRERRVRKRYLALLAGTPRADVLRCEAWLGRHPKDFRKRAVVHPDADDAREAQTTFLIRHRAHGYVVSEVRPRTGRTHQIRVHAAHLGHPVLADPVYGRARTWPITPKSEPVLRRHALHAWSLEVPHPAGGELTIQAPIPDDLAAWLPAGLVPVAW